MARQINEPWRDRYIRRSGEDYVTPFLGLLPQGIAWPRGTYTVLYRVVRGLAKIWGYVDGRAGDLLERESDPRKTIEMLDWWERAWGLPDPCFASPQTVAQRQRILVMWMTWLGGQSRHYFIDLAAWLGFTGIEIEEFSPFMAGISRVGDTRPEPDKLFRWYIGPAEQRFVWTISVGQIGLQWFRAASGQAGVNHHLEFMIPQEIICLIERWKPAHTVIVPDFTEMATGGPMQGTP